MPDDASDTDCSDDEGQKDVVVRVRQARERLVDKETGSKYGTAPIYSSTRGRKLRDEGEREDVSEQDGVERRNEWMGGRV